MPSFMNRTRTVSPDGGEDRHHRREPVPVDREAAQRVVEIQTYSRSNLSSAVGSFGSTTNAPSRPRPTWSVALWCEWYISEPGRPAVNS